MEAPCQKSAKVTQSTPSPSSSSSSSCSITNLPTPMLMEILCRLPIKTLAACLCVCKSWHHISRDPHFTELHQAKAPSEVFFQLYHDEDTIKLHMGNFNFDPLDVKINTLFEFPKFSVSPRNDLDYRTVTANFKFANSCNGLLCYDSGFLNKFAVVWNPCTSEYITLPAPRVRKTECCRYGLGFSGKTNKYKLMRVVSEWLDGGDDVVGEILTIEPGCSWKTLGHCPSDYCSSSDKYPLQSTFLHGTLHWACSRYSSEKSVLTFDFEDDRFGRVRFPPSFGKNIGGGLPRRVGELLGCLFVTEYTNEGMNIWLMKEYGVVGSWMKMYSLPCLEKGEGQILDQNRFLPLICMDDGEILLAHNNYISTGYNLDHYKYISTSVFSYDPDQEGFRVIGSGRGPLRLIAYRPSLVSLEDSMLGYEVHVSDFKHREMSTSPDWWTLLISDAEEESATSESSEGATYGSSGSESSEAMAALQHGTEGGKSHGYIGARKELCAQKQKFEERLRNALVKAVEPFKEQIEQLKKHNLQLEERLEDEKAKVKQMKEKIQQQSEQLEQQNRQLEKKLQDEKVKQMNEKIQQSEQLKQQDEKVKQMKEKTQQSEQLKQQNQRLEERLQNERAKVKQLEEKIQQSEQFKGKANK